MSEMTVDEAMATVDAVLRLHANIHRDNWPGKLELLEVLAAEVRRLQKERETILDAARQLIDESEEYDFDDGLGRGALLEHWDALLRLVDDEAGGP